MEALGLDGYRQKLEAASEAFVPDFNLEGVRPSQGSHPR